MDKSLLSQMMVKAIGSFQRELTSPDPSGQCQVTHLEC